MRTGFITIAAVATMAAAARATPPRTVLKEDFKNTTFPPTRATPPRTVLKEDFKNTTFPPTGWRLEKTGTGATWVRRAQGEKPYAYGRWVGSGTAEAAAHLISPKLTLAAGTVLDAEFCFEGTYTGSLESRFREMVLMKGTRRICYQEKLSPLAQGGSDYEFWWSYGGKAAGSSGTVTFSVNGIIIVEENVGVEPASLGRVRALYRSARSSNYHT
jgi:hypothetical protein